MTAEEAKTLTTSELLSLIEYCERMISWYSKCMKLSEYELVRLHELEADLKVFEEALSRR